jgi:hypothetical protein
VLLFFDKDRANKDDYLGFAALPLADLAKNGEFSCKDVSSRATVFDAVIHARHTSPKPFPTQTPPRCRS